MLRTTLICPLLWEGEMHVQLPMLKVGNRIHLDFTLPTKGKVEGDFRVRGVAHAYDSVKGYTQHLKLEPEQERG